MLRYYKEGTLSLEGLAKKLDVSISEAIDLLAKLGIEAPIEPEDYLICGMTLKSRFGRDAPNAGVLSPDPQAESMSSGHLDPRWQPSPSSPLLRVLETRR